MCFEDFLDYYENHHVPLVAPSASGVTRYVRRYIQPKIHPETGVWDEPEFDVITELWFDNEKVYRGTVEYLTSTKLPDFVIEDELNLFDRTSFRIATVIERE